MSEFCEQKIKGEVLQKFEFEGKLAAIVKLGPEDADTFADDLHEHAFNLAKNQETPNGSQDNEEVKVVVSGLGRKFAGLLGKLIKRDRSDLTARIESVTEGRKRSFEHMIKEGEDWNGNETEFLGVYLDGRIVSIMGVRKREKLSSGRQIYELTSGSTLIDADDDGQPKYAQKGFSKNLKKTLFDQKMAGDPDAVWMGDSKNPNVIASWERSGWTVVDVDDPSEFAGIFRQRNADHLDVYRKGVYKISYADPKVNVLKW
jgi:hypothetical protein